MTDKELKESNELKREIYDISHFIDYCQNCWLNLSIKSLKRKLKLHTNYGYLSDTLVPSKELTRRILKVCEDYKSELEKRFEEL